VSRIWDSLKKVEKHLAVQGSRDCAEVRKERVPDRRCSERVWAYWPVLVYGYTTEKEPFHEGTEALHVNANGGLITLTTAMAPGQNLLLINKLNNKEQECHVVCERPKCLERTAVVIRFLQPVSDFWDLEDGASGKT
jgi:hypothetical protein